MRSFQLLAFLAGLALLASLAQPTLAKHKTEDVVQQPKWFCVKKVNGVCSAPKGQVCCNKTIDEFFTEDHFDMMFKHRNEPTAHAQGFWDYYSFITAAKTFEPLGFGMMGGEVVQKREIAAFFAHVAHETTCGYSGSKDGPYAWGLCYKEELAPPKIYCDENLLFPCTSGVSYHGRGAMPIYWNYNYGLVGKGLRLDLLNNPGMIAENATKAFQAAIWFWMTPTAKRLPSLHDVMVNKWVPTTNDTLAFRKPGFGMTINIISGDMECGHGSDPRQEDRIAHYEYFFRMLAGESADIGDNLDCGSQGYIDRANYGPPVVQIV